VIGNRHAVAGAYLAAAALGVILVSGLIAAAAREVELARRRELAERRSAFAELERVERAADAWQREARRLAAIVDEPAAESS
jgi:hypothetical protein